MVAVCWVRRPMLYKAVGITIKKQLVKSGKIYSLDSREVESLLVVSGVYID